MTTGNTTPARNKYGLYCVPAGLEDRPASRAVLSGKAYEPDTLRFMRAHAGAGDVIHAGAFFGDFIPALSTALAPGAHLWAFEPNPGNFACAQDTVALNRLANVTLTNAALSDTDTKLLFRTCDADGKSLGGLSHFVDAPGNGIEPVPAIMLDYMVPLARPVTILQLDVEGHEKQALRGAYHLIHRWKPILILEYFRIPQWITRTFRGLGYEKIGKLHGNHVYATQDIIL